MIWTDEQKARVRDLWLAGHTTRQVATAIGGNITRSAVIGLLHRMGLSSKDQPPKPALAGIAAADKPKRAVKRARSAGLPSAIFGKPKIRKEPYIPAADDVILLRIAFDALKLGHCRYPYGTGPYTFCGHPRAPDRPYCAAHCAIAYIAPERRGRRSGKPLKASAQEATANAKEWLEEAA